MNKLKFTVISGTTGVTQNMYVYEYGEDMFILDCGVGFPEAEMLGVDLVIPDFSYVVKNKDRLRGIVISHGHEDHLGALPFLLNEISAPIYSTKLVAGFIEDKMKDYKVGHYNLNIFNMEGDVINLGAFKITPFRISHSVPDSSGFAIDTPAGRTYHIPDYKFDWTPVDGKPFDIHKLASLAAQKPTLMLASDSLGSTTPGYTESEIEIEARIENIVKNSPGSVFFTTISSNISRMQQALNVAKRLGRKVGFVGRSIERKAAIARELGYMDYFDSQVSNPRRMGKLPPNKQMYIISGSYGQTGSSLQRISVGDHQFLKIEKGDAVIFSGDPAPPGSKANVDNVVDNLFGLGVDVHYYDLQEDLHVSGHGSQKDIELLFAFLKPKYFVPIGGTVRHMRAYLRLAQMMGANKNQVLEIMHGESVEFADGVAVKAGSFPVKEVLVDGTEGDVGKIVLRDRKKLSEDGVVVALIRVDLKTRLISSKPDILSRGFVFEREKRDLLESAAKKLESALRAKGALDRNSVKEIAVRTLDSLFVREIKRRPMIVPVVVEV